MSRRKLVVWGFVVLLIGIGIFAYLGSRSVFFVYALSVVVIGTVHTVLCCKRCSNLKCAINPKGPDFFLGRKSSTQIVPSFSDIDAREVGLPLVLAIGIGFVGTWFFSPYATLALLTVTGFLGSFYWKDSCQFCTNNCPANRNPEYWAWKKNV
ncbi:MAG: hypothetical protein ACYC1U_06175 [Candidatus Aquicultorales bacterium]